MHVATEEEWEAWVPSKAVEELTVRRALQDREDPVKIANDLLKEALPLAVMGMTHTAMHETNPAIRMAAQKYVIDRIMGPAANPKGNGGDKPRWDHIYESVAVVADGQVGNALDLPNPDDHM
jgi:hypothetical protein